jgi:4-amino-4-deoxy-L-arabinose transferase-like glycosyltransferase
MIAILSAAMSQLSATHSQLIRASRLSHLAEPGYWLAALVCCQLVFWTLIPWLFSSSLPLDVVSDGLAWGHEWQWGYYKHPPLPSWAAETFFDAFGMVGPYLLSQVAVALTYLFVFLLGRSFMPTRWAAAGALLLAGVYYFSIPTPEFNHNVAQMPLWAAASYFYYKSWKSGATRWWIALGVAAGLGLLSKYSTAVLLIAIIAHSISTRSGRKVLLTSGPYLAILVCLAVLSFHLVWLFQSGFPTLRYAVGRAGHAASITGRVVAPCKFLLAQAVDIAPALIVAAIAGLLPLKGKQVARSEQLRFLLWLTLTPPLLTSLISLITGLGARDMWGAPMWNLTGLIVVEAGRERREFAALPRLAYCLIAVFGIGLCGYLLTNVFVPQWKNRPSRIQWPAQGLAQSFTAAWESREHVPLQIVAADGWLAGLVAMDARPRPSVWIDASFVKSPWITPNRVARQGALVLWRVQKNDSPPVSLGRLPGLKVLGTKSFVWPSTPGAQPLRIGYGIIAVNAAIK